MYVDNYDLFFRTQNFEIVETNTKETTEDNGKLYKVTSKLTIKKLDVKHGGSYTCRYVLQMSLAQ